MTFPVVVRHELSAKDDTYLLALKGPSIFKATLTRGISHPFTQPKALDRSGDLRHKYLSCCYMESPILDNS